MYLKKTRMKARMDTRTTVADKPMASSMILLVERPGGGGVVGVDENEERGVVIEGVVMEGMVMEGVVMVGVVMEGVGRNGVGREGMVVRGIVMVSTVDEGEGIAKGDRTAMCYCNVATEINGHTCTHTHHIYN